MQKEIKPIVVLSCLVNSSLNVIFVVRIYYFNSINVSDLRKLNEFEITLNSWKSITGSTYSDHP